MYLEAYGSVWGSAWLSSFHCPLYPLNPFPDASFIQVSIPQNQAVIAKDCCIDAFLLEKLRQVLRLREGKLRGQMQPGRAAAYADLPGKVAVQAFQNRARICRNSAGLGRVCEAERIRTS